MAGNRAELARRIGISAVSVGGWCSGKWIPSQRSLDAACQAMGLTLEEFWANPFPPAEETDPPELAKLGQ